MQVDIIELMRDGRPLSRDELDSAPRLRGNLIIEFWVEGNVFKRPVQRARLKGLGHGDPPDLVAPIFEPTLLKMTDDRMTLQGIQLLSSEGQVRQVIQEWMVRPRAMN